MFRSARVAFAHVAVDAVRFYSPKDRHVTRIRGFVEDRAVREITGPSTTFDHLDRARLGHDLRESRQPCLRDLAGDRRRGGPLAARGAREALVELARLKTHRRGRRLERASARLRLDRVITSRHCHRVSATRPRHRTCLSRTHRIHGHAGERARLRVMRRTRVPSPPSRRARAHPESKGHRSRGRCRSPWPCP